jgi:hypothetical protein
LKGQDGFGKGARAAKRKFPQWLDYTAKFRPISDAAWEGGLNRKGGAGDDSSVVAMKNTEGSMTIARTLLFSVLVTAAAADAASPAMAQSCTRQGTDVSCDDGKRGVFTGDAIVWADGSRSNLASPHPSVIVGNKSSVIVGPGVFVGSGKGMVPMENPSAKAGRCPVLDGVAYCY